MPAKGHTNHTELTGMYTWHHSVELLSIWHFVGLGGRAVGMAQCPAKFAPVLDIRDMSSLSHG